MLENIPKLNVFVGKKLIFHLLISPAIKHLFKIIFPQIKNKLNKIKKYSNINKLSR